jgi:hypothetical protein
MAGKVALVAGYFVITFTAARRHRRTIVLGPDQIKWEGFAHRLGGRRFGWGPDKKGPSVERVKLPPDAVVPPHTHPDTANITVLSDSSNVAGKSKGRMLPARSFYRLPANTPHYASAGPDGAVIQIHGVGPTGIKILQSAAQN